MEKKRFVGFWATEEEQEDVSFIRSRLSRNSDADTCRAAIRICRRIFSEQKGTDAKPIEVINDFT